MKKIVIKTKALNVGSKILKRSVHFLKFGFQNMKEKIKKLLFCTFIKKIVCESKIQFY